MQFNKGNTFKLRDQDDLAFEVHNLLINSQLTLALAESCTGGLIAHRLTNFSGASEYLKVGIIPYSNQAKIAVAQVDKDTIDKYEVISKDVAIELASNVRLLLNTDIGFGITGDAGPTRSTEKHPVGTAFVAIDYRGNISIEKVLVEGSRTKIKNLFADAAFKLLQKLIIRII
ncbi:MAG: CinA family protein [Candidatus Kariarchaeaceae archaeon]|jgi:nicotinamide-nucleotide amidase